MADSRGLDAIYNTFSLVVVYISNRIGYTIDKDRIANTTVRKRNVNDVYWEDAPRGGWMSSIIQASDSVGVSCRRAKSVYQQCDRVRPCARINGCKE